MKHLFNNNAFLRNFFYPIAQEKKSEYLGAYFFLLLFFYFSFPLESLGFTS